MPAPTPPRAEILSIGSEILLGEIVDTNAAFLAGELARLGFALQLVRELPDDRAVIAAGFAEARSHADLVVATGGLGPTHDDLTREGLADALGEEPRREPGLEAQLRRRMIGHMPAMNLRQATLIRSAIAIDNPIGSAPGWWVDRDARVTVLMPGVPSEMRRMWSEQVAPRLRARFALAPLRSRTVKTFGVGESAAAEKLGDLLTMTDPDAGIYARDDGVHIRFSTRGDPALLEAPMTRACALLGDDVYGTDDETLPHLVLAALARHGVRTLATHESGTHGALLAVLSAFPPADDATRFVGGGLSATASVDADAILHLGLLPEDGHGRSRVKISLEGAIAVAERQARIHGSGPQRMRRAAFAALDQVRRSLR